MIVKNLNKDEITKIYKEHMVNDFPADELKPLSTILKGMDKQLFECLGFLDKESGQLKAYAVFIKNGNNYLFDYLAVVDGNRNDGIGSVFLKQIAEHFKNADSVIGEVEDPDFAADESERRLRERRIAFYERNGYFNTGVKAKLFGVDFWILEMNLGKKHTKDEIKILYKSVYKKVLPFFRYLRCVKVKIT